MSSHCIVCEKKFKAGDKLQGFLRSPDCPSGNWTTPTTVDSEYQDRYKLNPDKIKRKHESCVTEVDYGC